MPVALCIQLIFKGNCYSGDGELDLEFAACDNVKCYGNSHQSRYDIGLGLGLGLGLRLGLWLSLGLVLMLG